MSRPESSCEFAGFKPLPKQQNTRQISSHSTIEVDGLLSPKSCQDEYCVNDQPGVICVNPFDNGIRITRKRSKPQMFDPSPPVAVLPTHKRRKGRPPGSGRKQPLPSLLGQGEVRIGKEAQSSVESLTKQTNICISPSLQSEGNNQLTPLQFGNKVIHVKTSPVILQCKQQSQNARRESEDVTGNHQPTTASCQEIQETTISDPPMHSQLKQNIDASPILMAITKKYGDILKDCPLKSGYMRTSLLVGICQVIQELERIELTELDSSQLCAYYAAVKDAEIMKLDVKWLHERLDEIQKVVQSNVEIKKLTEIKTRRMEQMEVMKKEVQNLKGEIEVKECQLAVETLEVEKLNSSIRGINSLSQRFQGKPLLDGLL